jgi:hypothetical protein
LIVARKAQKFDDARNRGNKTGNLLAQPNFIPIGNFDAVEQSCAIVEKRNEQVWEWLQADALPSM